MQDFLKNNAIFVSIALTGAIIFNSFIKKQALLIKGREKLGYTANRIIIFSMILFLGNFLHADLRDIYKTGTVKIVPDPKFGKNTEWDTLFSKSVDTSLAFLSDGSFFRLSSKDNKVYKFDNKGNLLFEFGQSGQGPGDINFPGDISILDGTYVVVNDNPQYRRISVFDLDGQFKRLIKTSCAVFDCVSLKNNHIAILCESSVREDNYITSNFNIFIRNIFNDEEKKVASFYQRSRVTKLTATGFYENAYISRFQDGTLSVAYSGSPELSIYSLTGEKLFSFKVNLQREKIIKKDLENYLNRYFNNEPNEASRKKLRHYIEQWREHIHYPSHFPYYKKAVVDSEDNVLVFLNDFRNNNADITFQVYSKSGEYLCATQLVSDQFKPSDNIVFYKNCLYSQLEYKETDDGTSRLIRTKLY